MANFRSAALLRLARGQDCQVQISGVCNGNAETVVAAHANWSDYGKGMSCKAHDWAVAWACSACHAEIDSGSRLSKAERQEHWHRGFLRTLHLCFQNGYIKVAR